jgi:hypothetical protein
MKEKVLNKSGNPGFAAPFLANSKKHAGWNFLRQSSLEFDLLRLQNRTRAAEAAADK